MSTRPRAQVYDSILELIGGTPIVRMHRVVSVGGGEIYAKCEQFNPGGSVKDRPTLNMIEEAERSGKLSREAVIIEPTSGNTGIGLALVCAVKGYRLMLCMPESMSLERRSLLKAYGAELVLTRAELGMEGAIAKANELAAQHAPHSFMPMQFRNQHNPDMHRKTTGVEIIEAFRDRPLDAFVSAVGTGGTITGTGEVLRKHWPNVKIFAVEPARSPVLSGGSPGPHKIQGIGAGFIPEILNLGVVDEIIRVEDNDAWITKQRIAREEGVLVGVSAGAAHWAAMQVSQRLGPGSRTLVIHCDTGERYFSLLEYFREAEQVVEKMYGPVKEHEAT
ncbi:MAG: Cysteine synthase [Myxococcota bacterium]|nr:Cysteine synthase [Myxococcota bacterium]